MRRTNRSDLKDFTHEKHPRLRLCQNDSLQKNQSQKHCLFDTVGTHHFWKLALGPNQVPGFHPSTTNRTTLFFVLIRLQHPNHHPALHCSLVSQASKYSVHGNTLSWLNYKRISFGSKSRVEWFRNDIWKGGSHSADDKEVRRWWDDQKIVQQWISKRINYLKTIGRGPEIRYSAKLRQSDYGCWRDWASSFLGSDWLALQESKDFREIQHFC